MKTIIENKEYIGEYISEWKPEYKNRYVITGLQQGREQTAYNRVGRAVQVRLEAGDYGSDCVFLRMVNDELMTHENQSFWLIPDKFKDYLDECFKDVHLDDSDKVEYTISGENPKKGFLIMSEIEGSTPMRDIKERIMGKIDEIISK